MQGIGQVESIDVDWGCFISVLEPGMTSRLRYCFFFPFFSLEEGKGEGGGERRRWRDIYFGVSAVCLPIFMSNG